MQTYKPTSVQPKQVVANIPGGPYKHEDLEAFAQVATEVPDPGSNIEAALRSPVADAWELAGKQAS